MAELIIKKSLSEIHGQVAEMWHDIAQRAVATSGRFSIALSGGSTPRGLFELLASDSWRDQLPWADTYVFWSDERRVSANHPDSNYGVARKLLLSNVPLPPENIFPMQGEGLMSAAVRDYENRLRSHFKLGPQEWPQFDLMLLGMGTDGHIASIFPGTRAVSDRSNMVLIYELPRLNEERVTLTLPVINHSHNVIVMVSGADKAQSLVNSLEGASQPNRWPAQNLNPVSGGLTWIVDKEAAGQLKRK
jgi:6-phosphogluconolactonase